MTMERPGVDIASPTEVLRADAEAMTNRSVRLTQLAIEQEGDAAANRAGARLCIERAEEYAAAANLIDGQAG